MSDLKDFLNWFAGYAENIEKAPTAKQWQRITAKVKALSESHASAEVRRHAGDIGMALPDAPVHRGDSKPTTKTAWKAQYQAALIEGGCDDETAADFANDAKVDLSVAPKDAAAETLNGLGIPTTH